MSSEQKPSKSPRLDSLSLRLGVLFVVLLLAAALLVGYLFDRGRAEAMERRELEQLKLHAGRAADDLSHHVEQLRSDTLFLAGTPPMQGIRRSLAAGGKDPVDASTDAQWRERLQQIFLTFAETRPEYLHLCLIGAADDGRELVRVTQGDGALRVVQEPRLVSKGDRYFFVEAARLPTGQVFLSQIDLEGGAGPVAPADRPTLRAATPVRDPHGGLFAVVVVSMDMGRLFADQRRLLRESERLYVADEQGELLHAPGFAHAFGFEDTRFYPVVDGLDRTSDQTPAGIAESGRFIQWGDGAVREVAFVTTRELTSADPTRRLTLIFSKPADVLQQQVGVMRRESLISMGLLMLGAAAIAVLVVFHLTRSLRQVAGAAEAIARGDYRKPLPAIARGEVGVLVRAFRRMADEVQSRELSLAELNRNLEGLIAERTRDLEESRAEVSRQQVLQQLILESVDDGVVVADTAGRFLLWNRKAAVIVGGGPEDVDPGRWAEHYGVCYSEDGELVPHRELPLARAIRGEPTDDFEAFLKRRKGAGRWVSLTGRPLRGADGKLEGGVVTLVDITDRKRLQGRLREHQGELARVGRLALMGEVAAMASHQLSQPVAAMANYAGAAIQLQRVGRLDEGRLNEILEHMDRLAGRAGQSLENLRALTRRGGGPPVDVDLNEVVHLCFEHLEDRLTKDGVRLELDLAEDLPKVRGDPMELEQMLIHLIINALDALGMVPRDKRRLWILTSREQEQESVQLEVRDSGAGVRPEIAGRLFEPWVSDKKEGLGVGLSIVRTLAEDHGGRVWAAPAGPSGGAAFFLEFPGSDRRS